MSNPATQRDNLRTVSKWLNEQSAAVPRKELEELVHAAHITAFCIHCKERDCQISLDGTCNMTRFYLQHKQETPT